MSRYTVLWDPPLESSFIEMWTKSDSRTRAFLTSVAHWIDEEFSRDPWSKGFDDEELNYRMVITNRFEPTNISVSFEILEPDLIVRIIRLNIRAKN